MCLVNLPTSNLRVLSIYSIFSCFIISLFCKLNFDIVLEYRFPSSQNSLFRQQNSIGHFGCEYRLTERNGLKRRRQKLSCRHSFCSTWRHQRREHSIASQLLQGNFPGSFFFRVLLQPLFDDKGQILDTLWQNITFGKMQNTAVCLHFQ